MREEKYNEKEAPETFGILDLFKKFKNKNNEPEKVEIQTNYWWFEKDGIVSK